ncbi:MAG TPA: hypothetical protein DDZ42_00490 [Candidatus Rokubacteria bacterium]|nr:hypothetical protein [Candidatus Rokubacteria bacterium]
MSRQFVHFDEARHLAHTLLKSLVETHTPIERAVLIADLFGKLRVVLWGPETAVNPVRERLLELKESAAPWWSGDVWLGDSGTDTDRLIYRRAWDEAEEVGDSGRFRILERHRTRGAWSIDIEEVIWSAPGSESPSGPPVVVFYSFKGGLGRSTALAAFAIQRARLGERVVVVDFDLDAPGIGGLLSVDGEGRTAAWGCIDYLLERPFGPVPIDDYYHVCRREPITGRGEIFVVPSGRLNDDYLPKLARLDLEPPPETNRLPLLTMLDDLRHHISPAWILLDARTGFSESAGLLLSGFAHLHVLFAALSEQNWEGLRRILRRLGASRLLRERSQAECLLVQSMVTNHPELAKMAVERFRSKAQDEFSENYYAEAPSPPEEDRLWHVGDLDSEDAPHVPISLTYEPRLTTFGDLADVADFLAESPDYRRLGDRISSRFADISEEDPA